MSGPEHPSGRRAWLIIVFSFVTLLFLYLLSFGPMLYVSVKTRLEHQPWFKYSIGAVYTPHLWCMTWSEAYYDYGWWWYALAKPASSKPTWEEWKGDR